MATKEQETAVRNYLIALRDPSALTDEKKIADLEQELASTDDGAHRLRLRQQIMDAQRPTVDGYEDAFISHAKAWADDEGISAEAFKAEGVNPAVLRKAGFTVRGGRRRAAARGTTGRSRVSADEVRKSIPRGTFTVKQVEAASGASPAVVRRVVQEEVAAGNVTEIGPDPDHQGRGRAPTLYKRG